MVELVQIVLFVSLASTLTVLHLFLEQMGFSDSSRIITTMWTAMGPDVKKVPAGGDRLEEGEKEMINSVFHL